MTEGCNNEINRIIFSALAARKSILIDGIGIVSVRRRGSINNNPSLGGEFPRYELTTEAKEYHLRLTDLIAKNALIKDPEVAFADWQKSVIITKGNRSKSNIKGCFLLTTKNGISTIKPYDELEILLNPLSVGKKGRRIPGYIILSLVVILLGTAYISYNLFVPFQPTIKEDAKRAIIPAGIIGNTQSDPFRLHSEYESAATDSIIKRTNSVVEESDSVEVLVEEEPKESIDGLTEGIKGHNYLVVGSFKSLETARSDAQRLERHYSGLKIKTTQKNKGDYINYIYDSPSFEDAMNIRDELEDKFDKIYGTWVYQMR